jgi:hypothetical protein
MGYEELKHNVRAAVETFLANDKELLGLDAHEQSISHRIAVYLEQPFEGFNVDCEYNRHGVGSKDVKLIKKLKSVRYSCRCDDCRNWSTGSQDKDNSSEKNLIRPDVLVHERKIDEKNEIVIEIKKDQECEFDKEKLRALTLSKSKYGEFGYKLGVFVYFPNNEAEYKWFENGVETNR